MFLPVSREDESEEEDVVATTDHVWWVVGVVAATRGSLGTSARRHCGRNTKKMAKRGIHGFNCEQR